MVGRPVLAGTIQLTSRLVALPEVAVTVGAFGASGGSSRSSTFRVTAIESVPPLPSVTVSVTE